MPEVLAAMTAGATGSVTSAMVWPGARNSTVVTFAFTICASSSASQFVSRTQP